MEASGHEEANYRTATDRAYLASALLLADVLLTRFGIEVPRTTRFYHVIEQRMAELDLYLKDRITFLRDIRNDADYDLVLAFDKNDAERAIAAAQGITDRLLEKFT
jgi:uncharacterized protein (UPF0332 family)